MNEVEQAAREWYIAFYDLHDLASTGLASRDEEQVRDLAAFHTHMLSQQPQPSR